MCQDKPHNSTSSSSSTEQSTRKRPKARKQSNKDNPTNGILARLRSAGRNTFKKEDVSNTRSRNLASSSSSPDARTLSTDYDPLNGSCILRRSRRLKEKNTAKNDTYKKENTFPRNQPIKGRGGTIERHKQKIEKRSRLQKGGSSTTTTKRTKNTRTNKSAPPIQSTRNRVKIIRHGMKGSQKMVLVKFEDNIERWIPVEQMHPDKDHRNNDFSLKLMKYYENFLVPCQIF